MTKGELETNLSGYCGDIKNFVRQKDYTSALRLLGYFRKYILDLKKQEVSKK